MCVCVFKYQWKPHVGVAERSAECANIERQSVGNSECDVCSARCVTSECLYAATINSIHYMIAMVVRTNRICFRFNTNGCERASERVLVCLCAVLKRHIGR